MDHMCMLICLIFLWVNDLQFLLEIHNLLFKGFDCTELLCLFIIPFLYLFLLFVSVGSIHHEIALSFMSYRTCEIDDDSLEIMRLVLNNFSNFGRTWMERFFFSIIFCWRLMSLFSTKSLNPIWLRELPRHCNEATTYTNSQPNLDKAPLHDSWMEETLHILCREPENWPNPRFSAFLCEEGVA